MLSSPRHDSDVITCALFSLTAGGLYIHALLPPKKNASPKFIKPSSSIPIKTIQDSFTSTGHLFTMTILRRKLSAGVVSAMGLGCMGMSIPRSSGLPDEEECMKVLTAAADKGINL